MITGITGQDGACLAKLLLDKGCEVFCAFRRTSGLHLCRHEFLGAHDEMVRAIKRQPFNFKAYGNKGSFPDRQDRADVDWL